MKKVILTLRWFSYVFIIARDYWTQRKGSSYSPLCIQTQEVDLSQVKKTWEDVQSSPCPWPLLFLTYRTKDWYPSNVRSRNPEPGPMCHLSGPLQNVTWLWVCGKGLSKTKWGRPHPVPKIIKPFREVRKNYKLVQTVRPGHSVSQYPPTGSVTDWSHWFSTRIRRTFKSWVLLGQ